MFCWSPLAGRTIRSVNLYHPGWPVIENVLRLCLESVFWDCVLRLCNESVFREGVLRLCNESAFWECVLRPCIDMVFSKSILRVWNDTVFWACELWCSGSVSCGGGADAVWRCFYTSESINSLTTPPTTMTATVAPRWGCTRGICHIGGRGCVGTPTVRENVTAEWWHTHAHAYTHLHTQPHSPSHTDTCSC